MGKEIKWGWEREEGGRITGKRERMAGFELVEKKAEWRWGEGKRSVEKERISEGEEAVCGFV